MFNNKDNKELEQVCRNAGNSNIPYIFRKVFITQDVPVLLAIATKIAIRDD
jgi:hypothetical protein